MNTWLQVWAALGPIVGVVIASLLARKQTRLNADLARKADAERDSRALLRSRMDAQHEAYADFFAYCMKHVPSGNSWDDAATRTEAAALTTKLSRGFGPKFAHDIARGVITKAATWQRKRDGAPYEKADIIDWTHRVMFELEQCIAATEQQAGLPAMEHPPVPPPRPKTKGEVLQAIAEHIPKALAAEAKKEGE
jgi:hypothetical protein